MKNKRVIFLVFFLLLSVIVAGCTNKQGNNNDKSDNTQNNDDIKDETVINIASLKGPTSIGMVKLMDEDNAQLNVNIYATADEIVPLIMSGKVDVANIPANLASVLYNRTEGKIKVININTLGVLYLVGTDSSINSFEAAKGKTIYMTGKGTTPEYALNYLLSREGLSESDFNIEYKSQAAEVVTALSKDKAALAVLPQPYATIANTQIKELNYLVNFADEWERLSVDSSLVTGVTVVRTEFLENHEGLINSFMKDLESSICYVNDNPEEMSASVEKYNIIKKEIAKKAIPLCNLKYIDGASMKTSLMGYLKTLYDQNKQAVGGALPKDDFYYETR